MKATIEPGSISGAIHAPSSKSMTQRAYAAALLHKGTTRIYNSGHSADELAALNIIRQLGAEVTVHGNITGINSNGISPLSGEINCGESGLAARLFTPIVATCPGSMTVTGEGSLLRRPMEGIKDIFPALGISLGDFKGFLPVTLAGPMQPGDISVEASSGSQLLSGLLFALAAIAVEPLTIQVSHLNSRPYIDMTLDMLAHFGRPITHERYKTFTIDPSRFSHSDAVGVHIEGDWSGAAAWLIAAAIGGSVTVRNLSVDSLQADKAVLQALRDAGADIMTNENSVTVTRNHLRAFEFDATHSPDLFPVLAILAACCAGESSIRGVHRLFHKESNRAESISEMLQNFDVPFSIDDDTLHITGVRRLSGTVIDSYNDHRIVMAAAIGGLRAGSRVDIPEAGCVSKSYPDFFKDLLLCGGLCALA